MKSWKTWAAVLCVATGNPAIAAENNNPFQATLMITSIAPTVIIGGATAATAYIPELFKSSKSDALVFMGSDGEIRGAQFEQAARYYRATYSPPLMTDQQLAQAIVAAF